MQIRNRYDCGPTTVGAFSSTPSIFYVSDAVLSDGVP